MADMLQEEEAPFTSGFVALVGRPSVGKSTLLNACMGDKLAITSPVAQTTRRRLRAVVNLPNSQLVIVDTPGLHKPKDALGKELNRVALSEVGDVDAVAFLIDATKPVGRGDQWVANHVQASPASYKILVITKADAAKPEQVESQLQAARELCHFDDEIVLSAQEGFNVDTFIHMVSEHLPEGPKWFPDDMDIDATPEELVAEFVREKVLMHMRDEIPHSVGVLCDDIEWSKGDHASVTATVFVERESQKGMVIGKGGRMIKRIGTEARSDIQRLLGADSVYLDLQVRVQPQWRRDANVIRRLGYQAED